MWCRLDEIIVFRQLTKGEVKQIADIMLGEVFKRAEEKEIKIDVTERFKVSLVAQCKSTFVCCCEGGEHLLGHGVCARLSLLCACLYCSRSCCL